MSVAEVLAPKHWRKEIIGERSQEFGEVGSGSYSCIREFVYVFVCGDCGCMVWEDQRAVDAHQKMHRDLKVAPLGLGSVFGR